ncbi:hypothetical protein KIPB_011850 [Kipferlia bialata]|uniref:Helicase-associated domain-containing protein n=1 Tax=Kipferlia bialata TaxID=797122 RepID=A0A9K3GNH7_9EUKA|nr:hypothetical protein KIPB_011850 [Kipferlia bialata]|eukprot:g11850.t1
MAKELFQQRNSNRDRVEREQGVQEHILKQEAEIVHLRALLQDQQQPSPPRRKRAAVEQPESKVASDRDRETDTPPTTSTQAQGDSLGETENGSSSVGCTTPLGVEIVASDKETTARHKRDKVASAVTDQTSETESHESTDEDTEDSAAGGDVVLMDGESEESEWEGSECSSSEEESDKGETDTLPKSVLISKNPETVALDTPPTETVVSPHTPQLGQHGAARDVTLPDISRDTSLPFSQDDRWQSRLAEVREYLASHDHWPSSRSCALGKWVTRQRRLRRKGILHSGRVAALDEIGID